MVLRIFTSMIEGGGASFVLMVYAAPVIRIAEIILTLGLIKMLMAIKPHENYEFA